MRTNNGKGSITLGRKKTKGSKNAHCQLTIKKPVEIPVKYWFQFLISEINLKLSGKF